MRKTLTLLPLLAMLAVAPVAAQEEDPGAISWIAFSEYNSGKLEEAVGLMLEDKAFYDGLMDNGTILSWGLVTPINHSPGDNWNFAIWVTTENWAQIEAWVGAFQAHIQGLSEKDQQSRQERGEEIFVDGSHFDQVVRNPVFIPEKEGSPTPRYFYVGSFSAKTGKESDAITLFKNVVNPVVEKLQSDGKVLSYGVHVTELHEDPGWTHRVWYAMPDLAAIDSLGPAFQEVVGPSFEAWAESIFEPMHDDKVLMILHYGGTAAEE